MKQETENPIIDTIKLMTFIAISPLYLVCDILVGGLDN